MLTAPKYIGSRELKTRLGTYLRLVREGVTLIVTDRGRPVAELRPVSLENCEVEHRLQELAAAGVISSEIAERPALQYFEPISTTGACASEAVIEDREDRF